MTNPAEQAQGYAVEGVVGTWDADRADLTLALDLLEKHQWCAFNSLLSTGPRCRNCGSEDTQGHKPDCALAQLLNRGGRAVTLAKSD